MIEHHSEPETIDQANTFSKVVANYTRFGLCHRCAAQAGWLHQLGAYAVHPPCDICTILLSILPEKRLNGWSVVSGKAALWSNFPQSGTTSEGLRASTPTGTPGRAPVPGHSLAA